MKNELTTIPAVLPSHIWMRENARKRKMAAELTFDATGEVEGWWLVCDERLRVGLMRRAQVETLLRNWFENGCVVQADDRAA